MILLMPSGSLICSTFNQTWRVGKCPSSTYIWSKKVEKNHPQKLLRNTQIFFNHSCQNDPTGEFRFQNVAYRPTV